MNTCEKDCSNSRSAFNANACSRLLECTTQTISFLMEDAKNLCLIFLTNLGGIDTEIMKNNLIELIKGKI